MDLSDGIHDSQVNASATRQLNGLPVKLDVLSRFEGHSAFSGGELQVARLHIDPRLAILFIVLKEQFRPSGEHLQTL